MKNFFVLFALVAAALALDDAKLQEFKSGNNLLTSDIYKELTKTSSENFLVSPFSLETALALTHSGAKDATAEEIRTSLRLPNNKQQTEEIISGVLRQLKSEDYTLHSANKVYVKEKFPVREEFQKVATEIYQADWQNIDFTKKEEAVKEINQWVETQTKDKIHDIVSSDGLNDDTALVLINALYFKGNWTVPFEPSSTRPKEFHKEKEVVTVDTMHATEDYNYYESSELQAKLLELPFKGGDASMVIVLPNEKNGILGLESKIDKVFTAHNFTSELVRVALPKFKIETSIDFVPISKKLGIKKVFDGDQADLSGIAGQKGDLTVSSILQKTFIEVGEWGVEAAAATAVHIVVESALIETVPPKLFTADHPFIFYIKVKDVVLFGGRVLLPKH